MIDEREAVQCHSKQIRSFFVRTTDGVRPASQFTLRCSVPQNAYITISPCPVEDDEPNALGRLVLVQQGMFDSTRRTFGFTLNRNSRNEFYYSGKLPIGKLSFIPVPGNALLSKSTKSNYVKALTFTEGKHATFTKEARNAVDTLFLLLDSNSNCFLSQSEVSVFKKLLGFAGEVTLAEWEDLLSKMSHTDGSDQTAGHIIKFLLLFVQGEFLFRDTSEELRKAVTPTGDCEEQAEGILRFILDRTGFNKGLELTAASSFVIRVCTRRNVLTYFKARDYNRIPLEKAILSVTRLYGVLKSTPGSSLYAYLLVLEEWFSISIKNKSGRNLHVAVDCRGCKGVVKSSATNRLLQWERLLAPGEKKLAMGIANENHTSEFHIQCLIMFKPQNQLNGCGEE